MKNRYVSRRRPGSTDRKTKYHTEGSTEVDRVLMEKVFPRQATVITNNDFLRAIGSKIIR